MVQTGPLRGLRVIEMGGYSIAFAGRLLADAGADVFRLRGKQTGNSDVLVFDGPFFARDGPSIPETWYNAGKRLGRSNLEDPDDRRRFLADFILNADILIEDWSPRAALFTRAELAAANPTLVQVSVTPFGLQGPRASWRTNDLVANAMSGAASVTGNATSGPISGYGNQTHHTVGLYAAVCALASFRAARSTGAYQHVDVSEHEALVSCTEQVLMQWFFPEGAWGTPIAERLGSLHWSRAYEVYPSADGDGVMVTAALRFADVLLPWLVEDGAAQDLADPEKYPNVLALIRDLPHVMEVLREWVASRESGWLFHGGQERHQPFGIAWNIEQVLKSPQIAARNYLHPTEVPGFGAVQFPGRFFRTSADGEHPKPGEDVDEFEWALRRSPPARAEAADPSRPLGGIRILDFTHVLAGPFGTRVLGDLGADVIKVGTAVRGAGANAPEHPYYTMWNRNKRHITINMATAEGRDFARKLANKCDVIIENFSAGVLKRWGMDREGLRETNPGITVISMGGMGQDGPWKDFVTFAPTIHALTGLTYLTNPPGEHMLGYGFSLTDHLSGLAGALAALEGIEHRERTGQGIAVDLSQYELGLGLMAPALIDYLANGVNPEPVGNRHPFGDWAPHGIYTCAGEDRWVAIAVRGDEEWAGFASLPGLGLAKDARFASHAERLANQDALAEAISAWTGTRDALEVAEMCQAVGIAAGPVQNARDLTENDPQLAESAFFGVAVSHAHGEYGIDQFPARFNGERPSIYHGPHAIGEDTFDVATQLVGLSDDDFADLVADGALT